MRWETRKKPLGGDKRVVSRFLLLPTALNGETRWLEWAKIQQEYTCIPWETGGWWKNRRWV